MSVAQSRFLSKWGAAFVVVGDWQPDLVEGRSAMTEKGNGKQKPRKSGEALDSSKLVQLVSNISQVFALAVTVLALVFSMWVFIQPQQVVPLLEEMLDKLSTPEVTPTIEVVPATKASATSLLVSTPYHPQPTYTPYPPNPTYTPYPTHTAYPPNPTYTPYPTHTAYPPNPTYTPYPNPTLSPTAKPIPESLLFEDDFDVGPRSEWEIVSGTWGTANGQFTLISISERPTIGIALVGDTSWDNYAVEFDVTGLHDYDDPGWSGLQLEGYSTEDMETVYSSRAAVLVGIDEKGNGAGFIIGENYMVWGTFSNGLWSNIISGTLVQAYGDEGGHLIITVQGNLYKVYDSEGAMITSFSTLGSKGGRVGVWLNSHLSLSASDWRAVPKIDNFSVTPLD